MKFNFKTWLINKLLLKNKQLQRYFTCKNSLSQVVFEFNKTAVPPASTLAANSKFLVIDLELTGLNPKKDHIVSIGWVAIHHQEIQISSAKHYLIRSPVSVGQSAVYHGLHDNELKDAHELTEILTLLLSCYAGYVFVAHNSRLDEKFLRIACKKAFGKAPYFRFIDTMQIEWQRLIRQGKAVVHDALKLPHCLKRHNLPAMQNHQALEDAYSCALLLLSQMKLTDKNVKLRDLYLLSRY